MTTEEKTRIAVSYATVAEIFGRQLSGSSIRMMVESLADLPFRQTQSALESAIGTFKAFPMPNEIRGLVAPDEKPEDLARIAASRILDAMRKYGYTNPERAQAHIGPLGWEVVQRQGGWENLCASIQSDREVSTYQAQWRDLALSLHRRAKAGRLDEAPGLPPPDPGVLKFIETAMQPWNGGDQ